MDLAFEAGPALEPPRLAALPTPPAFRMPSPEWAVRHRRSLDPRFIAWLDAAEAPRTTPPWRPGHVSPRVVGSAAPVRTSADRGRSASPQRDVAKAAISRLPGLWANRYRYQANASANLITIGDVQLFVGYDADGHPAITRRGFPDGDWSAPSDLASVLGSGVVDSDSHNTMAVGVAPDGRVFVVADHHVDSLHVAVAPSVDALDRFVRYSRDRLGRRDTDRVTYPHFVNDGDGRLYLSYREQEVGGGRPRFRWLVKRLEDNDRWTTVGELNRGTHLRLYLSALVRCPRTGRLHATGLWRDDDPARMARATATARQHDLFHLILDPVTGRWLQYADTAGTEQVVEPPFLWRRHGGHAITDVPYHILRTPPSGFVGHPGSLVVDATGWPHLVHRMTDGRVMYRRFVPGRGWVSRRMDRSTSQALFVLDARVGLLIHTGAEVAVRYPIEASRRIVASGYTSPAFRIHADPGAGRLGSLSFLMTRNRHASPGETDELAPMPMHVVTATGEGIRDIR